LKQKDLGGAEKEKAVSLLGIRKKLHAVQQGGLFLDLIQNHQTRAMGEAPYRVGGQVPPFIRIIQGEKDGRSLQGGREEFSHHRGFPGLPGTREHSNRPFGQTCS
jgi:hypothetical protein